MRSLPTLARRAAALFAVCAFLVPLVVFASTQSTQRGGENRIVLDVETSPYSFLSFEPIDNVYLLAPDGRRIAPSDQEFGNYSFTELEHDEYGLRIDDPRFQRLEREGLKPGKRALAWLRPSSGVVLDVVDAATGEAVERYGVSARLVDAEWRPNTYDLQSRRRRPPADHFHPIPPAQRFALAIDSKDHGLIEIPQEALAAGERREVRVELHAAVTVRGRIVRHDGVTPVGGGRVMLRRPGDAVTSYEPRTFSTPAQVPPLLYTDVDANGEYSFECAPGTYALHVVQDEWLDASLDPVSISAEGVDGLVVELPPTWSMRGRVSGGDLNAIRGAVVRAYPRSPYKHIIMADRVPLRVATVGDDGSFVIGLLPEGDVLFQLQAWPTHDESGRAAYWSPPEIDLGVQSAGPGATLSHVFVVSEWPTRCDVVVTVNGEAPHDAHVSLQGSGDSTGMRGRELDADGRGSLRFVMPGSYTVRVRFESKVGRERIPIDVSMPDRLEARTGEPATLECRITTSTGSVRVVDEETGEPIAGERMCLWHAGDQHFIDTTDDDGRLEMTLPAGRYRLENEVRRRRPHEPADWTAVVTWTEDGPSDPTLRMHRGRQ